MRKRVSADEFSPTVTEDRSGITIEMEPGLRVKYRRVLFHPDVFESLLRWDLIGEGGDFDGEPTYDLTSRYTSLMRFFDFLRAEVRRPSKGRKKGGRS